jgi:tRNA-splicing ligase RtcB
MKFINTENIPIKMWLDDIEDGALQQAKNLANLPFAFSHIAIMPDSHQGYGMPIGGVMATRAAIVPNAVGVDIGCGMRAIKTSLHVDDMSDTWPAIVAQVRRLIPVGFNHHKDAQDWDGFAEDVVDLVDSPVVYDELESARYQLGTLGGGNHFIEFQCNKDGRVWVMLHSGSRNVGLKIAKYYHDMSKSLCEKWYSKVSDPDLAFLPIESDQGREYFAAMRFALDFARESRSRMMEVIKGILDDATGGIFDVGEEYDVHHNYAAREHHYGADVIVHRKGATSAKLGEIGLIPGSQGTKSYVVRGKGNHLSFESCSHGAGRKMGRKQAQRTLNLADEQKRLDDLGVVHNIRSVEDLDEAAGAYKDIDVVMRNQCDLVDIVEELTPLAVVKA